MRPSTPSAWSAAACVSGRFSASPRAQIPVKHLRVMRESLSRFRPYHSLAESGSVMAIARRGEECCGQCLLHRVSLRSGWYLDGAGRYLWCAMVRDAVVEPPLNTRWP